MLRGNYRLYWSQKAWHGWSWGSEFLFFCRGRPEHLSLVASSEDGNNFWESLQWMDHAQLQALIMLLLWIILNSISRTEPGPPYQWAEPTGAWEDYDALTFRSSSKGKPHAPGPSTCANWQLVYRCGRGWNMALLFPGESKRWEWTGLLVPV